jgi:hydroxypyruvate isomerase
MSRRLAANLGFLWTDLPLPERIRRAAAAGFDAVELHDDAQRAPLGPTRAALEETGLPLLGINARMGETQGRAALAGHEAGAREDVEEALETALALGGTAIHLLGGRAEPSAAAMARYAEALAWACERAVPEGIGVLVEPLCAEAAPGYVLGGLEPAARLVRDVGHPGLRIMFDLYHMAREPRPIAGSFAAHAGLVGHVQIADPETRAEPRLDGPPESAMPAILAALAEAGYDGDLGCEYRPAGAVEDGLAWLPAIKRRVSSR